MKIFGFKLNPYVVLAIAILILIISSSTGCGCMKCSFPEAFSTIKDSAMGITEMDPSKYDKIPNHYKTNKLVGNDQQSNLIFKNNEFSHKCCKNNQSNYFTRSGCVCATEEQLNHLTRRGGNHT
jgi:hypothetical protein